MGTAGDSAYKVWAVEQKNKTEGTQTTAKVPRQLLTSGPIISRPLQKNLFDPSHVLNDIFCATPRCLAANMVGRSRHKTKRGYWGRKMALVLPLLPRKGGRIEGLQRGCSACFETIFPFRCDDDVKGEERQAVWPVACDVKG